MPLPQNNTGLTGAAGALGLDLSQQVKSETDEERKKRMMLQQQQQSLGPAGSMAVTSIFGPTGGMGG